MTSPHGSSRPTGDVSKESGFSPSLSSASSSDYRVIAMDERPDPGRLDDFIPEVERNPSPTDINTTSAGLYAWRQRQAKKAADVNQVHEQSSKEEPQLIRNYDLHTEEVPNNGVDVSFTNSNSSYLSLSAAGNSVNASFRTANSATNGHQKGDEQEEGQQQEDSLPPKRASVCSLHYSPFELAQLHLVVEEEDQDHQNQQKVPIQAVPTSSSPSPTPSSPDHREKGEENSDEDQSLDYILEPHHWPVAPPPSEPISSGQPSLETILETLEESTSAELPFPTPNPQVLVRRLSLNHPTIKKQPSQKKSRSEYSGTPPLLASNLELNEELRGEKDKWMTPIEIRVDKPVEEKSVPEEVVVPIRIERPPPVPRVRVERLDLVVKVNKVAPPVVGVEEEEVNISKTSYKFYDKHGREIWPVEGWKHRRSRVAVEEGEEISLAGDTREWRQFLAEQRLPSPGNWASLNRIDADSRFRIIHPTANNSNNNQSSWGSTHHEHKSDQPKITRPIIQNLERPVQSGPVSNGYSSLGAGNRRPRPAAYTGEEQQRPRTVQWVHMPDKHKTNSLVEPSEVYGEKKKGGRKDAVKGPGEPKTPIMTVSGRHRCSHCGMELGRGAAMIVESLNLFYHLSCFRCFVCNMALGNGQRGADVRVRGAKLHCQKCFSTEENGIKSSGI